MSLVQLASDEYVTYVVQDNGEVGYVISKQCPEVIVPRLSKFADEICCALMERDKVVH